MWPELVRYQPVFTMFPFVYVSAAVFVLNWRISAVLCLIDYDELLCC